MLLIQILCYNHALMWLLIRIIKLPVTVLTGTEAAAVPRWLAEGFYQILDAFLLFGWGVSRMGAV